ncbi:MAG: nucleoside phosphorylase [Bacteroidota bacterium]
MREEFSSFILANKNYEATSVFLPENLLRESRRQKNISDCNVPEICILDPDGDLADYLLKKEYARKSNCWACYHSNLYTFQIDDIDIGIIPCIVGASYAVLVAEQLFVSGCKYLISVTSAGIIKQPSTNKRFALITEAIRDEGTSYHYLPKEVASSIPEKLYQKMSKHTGNEVCPWFDSKSWTTDAPYRETATAISAMETENVTCVEMEAAALYAFALAKNKNVICFAHLTNTMAQQKGDFEKGEYFGSIDTINLLKEVTKRLGYKSY